MLKNEEIQQEYFFRKGLNYF